ncbi:MAG: hypothetical protein ACRELA_21915, partial [Candidatus Rokuibacteriota bacterium]
AMDRADDDPLTHGIEFTVKLDRHALEALRLELRRLAARFGGEVTALRVERATDEPISLDEIQEAPERP